MPLASELQDDELPDHLRCSKWRCSARAVYLCSWGSYCAEHLKEVRRFEWSNTRLLQCAIALRRIQELHRFFPWILVPEGVRVDPCPLCHGTGHVLVVEDG